MWLSGLSDRVKRRERGNQDDKTAAMKLVIRVAIYLRVSLEEQAESGHGLHAQEDAARAYACVRDGKSLTSSPMRELAAGLGLEGRPGLLDAIATLDRGDVLLSAKRDRINAGTPCQWP